MVIITCNFDSNNGVVVIVVTPALQVVVVVARTVDFAAALACIGPSNVSGNILIEMAEHSNIQDVPSARATLNR